MKTQQTLEFTDANFNEEVLERDRTVPRANEFFWVFLE